MTLKADDLKRYQNITYDDFKRLAQDTTLSSYQKIGTPDAYRAGKDELIWNDIRSKLTNLNKEGQTVLDLGPGCSELPKLVVEHCSRTKSDLILCDSAEMLGALSPPKEVTCLIGPFPDCWADFEQYRGKIDVLICYSVLHYVFIESRWWEFLDRCMELLAVGGQCLFGDIPNESKRRRFLSSPSGAAYHKANFGSAPMPELKWNQIEQAKFEDSVLYSIVMRCRAAGFDAYLMPQSDGLPQSNRREDILVVRP